MKNTRQQAIEALVAFVNAREGTVLLLNGTHQNEKHTLALGAALLRTPIPASVLFRANSRPNAENFLAAAGIRRVPQPGVALTIQGHRLFVDTINPQSWKRTPGSIDVAVVYPLGALEPDSGSSCVEDLKRRGAKKIFLVTWTDTKDPKWVDHYKPVLVTYDAESERPEDHDRIRAIEQDTTRREVISNLPKYAENTPAEYLIRIDCCRCRKTVWAKLNKPYPGIDAVRNAPSGAYKAVCLKCGVEADDNYNWYGR